MPFSIGVERARTETMFGVGGGGGTGSAADVPTLSAPNAGTPTTTGSTNSHVASTAGSGTLYVGVVTNGGSATNAQIITGTGGNLVAAASLSQAVSASGTQTVAAITGLTTGTTYQILFLHVAGNNEVSNQSSVSLTTA